MVWDLMGFNMGTIASDNPAQPLVTPRSCHPQSQMMTQRERQRDPEVIDPHRPQTPQHIQRSIIARDSATYLLACRRIPAAASSEMLPLIRVPPPRQNPRLLASHHTIHHQNLPPSFLRAPPTPVLTLSPIRSFDPAPMRASYHIHQSPSSPNRNGV